MRVNFRPLDSLEIGISRTAQWYGDGRLCGFDIFSDLFLGKDNVGDAGTTLDNEPGNQMAGFDVRWTNFWFGVPIPLYGQMTGEDEAGGFPSRYLGQFGIEVSGITRGQYSYRWLTEAAGTSCDIVKRTVIYGCGYRQGSYQSGNTDEGRVIGHGLDNDAQVLSAGVVVVNAEGNSWQVLGQFDGLNGVGPEAGILYSSGSLGNGQYRYSAHTKHEDWTIRYWRGIRAARNNGDGSELTGCEGLPSMEQSLNNTA